MEKPKGLGRQMIESNPFLNFCCCFPFVFVFSNCHSGMDCRTATETLKWPYPSIRNLVQILDSEENQVCYGAHIHKHLGISDQHVSKQASSLTKLTTECPSHVVLVWLGSSSVSLEAALQPTCGHLNSADIRAVFTIAFCCTCFESLLSQWSPIL